MTDDAGTQKESVTIKHQRHCRRASGLMSFGAPALCWQNSEQTTTERLHLKRLFVKTAKRIPWSPSAFALLLPHTWCSKFPHKLRFILTCPLGIA